MTYRIFRSIFYYRDSVVIGQSSIFYHFNNLYLIAIVKVLFLIHPLEKDFKEGYIFLL